MSDAEADYGAYDEDHVRDRMGQATPALRRTSMPNFEIKKATKSQSKLRMAMFGPSGSGKTMSALRIATGLLDGTDQRIGVIDTERGSASKYSGKDRFDFDVIELNGQKDIQTMIGAINAFGQAGHGVLIIDSLTHAWQELLAEIDRLAKSKYKGNTWSAWSDGTPKQRTLVDAILDYPGHVIATMRSKTEWTTETDTRTGKSKPVRVGLAPEQGKGMEYEFDVLLELSTTHVGEFIKDRTGKYQDMTVEKPSEELGRELAAWLLDGVEAVEPPARPEPTTRAPARPATPQRPAHAAQEAEFPDEPPPGTLGDEAPAPAEHLDSGLAKRLHIALTKMGVKQADHLEFASTVTDREITSFTELTIAESRRVHATANGEGEEAA